MLTVIPVLRSERGEDRMFDREDGVLPVVLPPAHPVVRALPALLPPDRPAAWVLPARVALLLQVVASCLAVLAPPGRQLALSAQDPRGHPVK